MENDKPVQAPCPQCGGLLEFPANRIGEVVDCPLCQKPILLDLPANLVSPVKKELLKNPPGDKEKQDENPLHEWIVLFKKQDSDQAYRRKTFEYEDWAVEFARSESQKDHEKIFKIGRIDRTTRYVSIRAEYRNGEDLWLKKIINLCNVISSFDRTPKQQQDVMLVIVAIIGLFGAVAILFFSVSTFGPTAGVIIATLLIWGMAFLLTLPFKNLEKASHLSRTDRDSAVDRLCQLIKIHEQYLFCESERIQDDQKADRQKNHGAG